MGAKVAKFGGSSLGDAGMFRKVHAIVEADASRRYVVPSAPGKRDDSDQKITDLLYLCHANAAQGVSIDEVFGRVADRYLEIVAALGLSLDLQPHLDEVRAAIEGGASADYTASRGEYLNGLVMADLIGFTFVDAAEIVFFDDHGRFDADRTQTTIRDRLANVKRAVVPGFYGSMPDGNVKTFSRGGSDITGAIVARGVDAEVYENWTDVSGLLMTDPRIIDQPRHIDLLTYRELRELAYSGATVLHDEAIFPVREAGIPVNIRNTNDPDHPGTTIVSDAGPSENADIITGIAGRRDFTVIAIEKALMNAEIGFGRRVLGVLERHGISFEHMPSSIDTLSLVIADAQLNDKRDTVIAEIEAECQADSIEVHPNMALIATVGRGMAHHVGTAGRLFGALGAARVNVRMIDQGSSEQNIIVGVEADDYERAIRAIYEKFVQ